MQTPFPLWLKLTLLCLVAGLSATAFVVLRKESRRQANAPWESYRLALAAAGEPLSFSEIEALRPTIPPGSNGAIIVEQLFDELDTLGDEPSPWVPFFDDELQEVDPFFGIPRRAVEPMRAFLREHSSTIDALSKLRDLPDGRLTGISYDYEGDNPLEVLLPSLRPWRNAGKLQGLLSLSNLTEGDLDSAAEAVIIHFNVAGTLKNEPNVIGRLVRLTILRGAVSAVEAALRVGELELHRLEQLEGLIEAHLKSISPKSAMQAERVCLIKVFDSLATGKITLSDILGEELAMSRGSASLAEIREEQMVVTEKWTRLIEVADDPAESLAVAERIDSGASSLSLAGYIMPSTVSLTIRSARGIATLRCAQAALAAERYRLANNRLPQSFAELMPDFLDAAPIDPFNGKPLRLITSEDGIVIYSVDEDMTDDGGDFTIPEGAYSQHDTGFRLFSRARRGTIVMPMDSYDETP